MKQLQITSGILHKNDLSITFIVSYIGQIKEKQISSKK